MPNVSQMPMLWAADVICTELADAVVEGAQAHAQLPRDLRFGQALLQIVTQGNSIAHGIMSHCGIGVVHRSQWAAWCQRKRVKNGLAPSMRLLLARSSWREAVRTSRFMIR